MFVAYLEHIQQIRPHYRRSCLKSVKVFVRSPSSYPCQWVSDSFRCDAIASPSFESLFLFLTGRPEEPKFWHLFHQIKRVPRKPKRAFFRRTCSFQTEDVSQCHRAYCPYVCSGETILPFIQKVALKRKLHFIQEVALTTSSGFWAGLDPNSRPHCSSL